MKKYYKWSLLFLLSTFITGCMVGPDYHPPANCVPDNWSCDALSDTNECPPPTAWWVLFNDPLLNKYIEEAALFNNDILTAEATIYQARALRKIASSQLFPQIDIDLNYSRTYFSKNGPVFSIGLGNTSQSTGLPFTLQVPNPQTLFNALLDVTWEIDLFGKIRRSVEAAVANIGSAIEQRNDILITVLAEVARNYMELRSNQQRGVLLEENIQLLEKSADIVYKRWEAGYVNRLDVDRIEAELAQLRAELPPTFAQIYQNIYTLSILTGSLPEALLDELLPIQSLPDTPKEIAIGLRSDLLRRRPDVRKAERDLAAATANIGVAVASFFPTFSLFGDVGFQSLMLSNLFQGRSLTWAFGGDILAPIFQGGNLVGNLRLSEGQTAAAYYTYKQVVLNALQETESVRTSYTNELQIEYQLNIAVDRYRKLVNLSNTRFANGLISLTDLLDIQRQLNTSEQNLVQSQTSVLLDLILLYKSIGGGWEPVEECS